ncbi:MAG: LVIVD repeat-containing protein [Planctomycetota bacterium]
MPHFPRAWGRSIAALALCLGLAPLFTSCAAPCGGDPPPAPEATYAFPTGGALEGAVLREVINDEVALDYVVKSRIYPEAPDTLFLTLRGGGVSVYDLANPRRPRLVSRTCPQVDVEGQDRRGDLLVVIARSGKVLTFDAKDRTQLVPLGALKLRTNPGFGMSLRGAFLEGIGRGPFDALHTAIYEPRAGQLHCLVTATNSRELIAVDLTDPARPRQVSALDTEVDFVEGLCIKGGFAFVGGFGSSEAYTAIDVRDPANMRIAKTLRDPAYRQMVPARTSAHPNIIFAALWDDPGGLGTFDVTDPADLRPLDTLTRRELRRANRVKLAHGHAFLPLEQDPGGFGVVDVTRPDRLKLVAVIRGVPGVTTPYTLAVHGDWLYLFGTGESSMAVLELLRTEAGHEDEP